MNTTEKSSSIEDVRIVVLSNDNIARSNFDGVMPIVRDVRVLRKLAQRKRIRFHREKKVDDDLDEKCIIENSLCTATTNEKDTIAMKKLRRSATIIDNSGSSSDNGQGKGFERGEYRRRCRYYSYIILSSFFRFSMGTAATTAKVTIT